MGLILRGNTGRRISESEFDGNFIYLNGLLGLTSDIKFVTNGGGGITYSFINGLLSNPQEGEVLVLQINSITNQSCNTETGTIQVDIDLDIQNVSNDICLEYKLDDNWISYGVVYDFIVLTTMITLPTTLNGLNDIQFRLAENKTSNYSEVYTTDIIACEATGEILVINSITDQSCNTETGELTATFNCNIQNPVGQIKLEYNDGSLWYQYVTNGENINLNCTIFQGESNAQFRLHDIGNDAYSETFITDIISCEISGQTSVVLNSVEIGNEIGGGKFDVSYVVAYAFNGSTANTEVSDDGETGWITFEAINMGNDPVFPLTLDDVKNTAFTPVDRKYFRVVVKDVNDGIVYSNVVQIIIPVSIVSNSLTTEMGNLKSNLTCFGIYERAPINVLFAQQSDDGINDWTFPGATSLPSSPFYGTSDFIFNFSPTNGRYYRFTGKNVLGDDINSNTLQYVPFSGIIIDHADSNGQFYFATNNIYEYTSGQLDLQLQRFDGNNWIGVDNQSFLNSNPDTNGWSKGFNNFIEGYAYRLSGRNILEDEVVSNSFMYYNTELVLTDLSNYFCDYISTNAYHVDAYNNFGDIKIYESPNGVDSWFAVSFFELSSGEPSTFEGQVSTNLAPAQNYYYKLVCKNQFGDLVESNVLYLP